MPPRADSRSPWWRRTTSRREPPDARPGWSTAVCGTSSTGSSVWSVSPCGSAGCCSGWPRTWSGRCPCTCWRAICASRARYGLGLTGYDLMAAGRNVGVHRPVTASQIRRAIPGIGGPPSRGYRYFECQTDDARLTIEVARAAQASGAVLANHARVSALLGGARVTGAVAADEDDRAAVRDPGQGHGERGRGVGRSGPRPGCRGRRFRGPAPAEQGRAPGVRAGSGPDQGGAGGSLGGGRRALCLPRPVGGPGLRRDDRHPVFGRPGSPGRGGRRPRLHPGHGGPALPGRDRARRGGLLGRAAPACWAGPRWRDFRGPRRTPGPPTCRAGTWSSRTRPACSPSPGGS